MKILIDQHGKEEGKGYSTTTPSLTTSQSNDGTSPSRFLQRDQR